MAMDRDKAFAQVEKVVGATYDGDDAAHSNMTKCIQNHDDGNTFGLNRVTKGGYCFKCDTTWSLIELCEALEIETELESE